MSTDVFKLAQDLDVALAAYQRFHGRPRTIEKLQQLLASREAAQKLMDEAVERAGTPTPRAAE